MPSKKWRADPQRQPSGHIKDACCEYSDVNRINDQISPLLQDLVKTSFFRYYKVNLEKGCPFWKENHRCYSIDCAVATVDESEVAEQLKTVAISKADFSTAGDNGFGLFHRDCEFSENDFCVVEENDVRSEGVYVNLLLNPERFTGYAGESAARIWNALYKENCFPLDDSGSRQLTSDHQRSWDDTCTEKRVLYRLISGLHASISTHICDKYLDGKTGIWYRNLDCFLDRVGRFPERVENLYFTYAVLLRAVTKLSPYLKTYSWCAGVEGDKGKIKSLVRDIVKVTKSCPPAFDETQLFANSSSDAIKEEFKMHFRNISRIMDCDGCEKCRLWGKLQISGLGTALKILFSFGNKVSSYHLTRSELVALINGFARVSNSLSAVARFRAMTQQEALAAPLDAIDGKEKSDEWTQSTIVTSGTTQSADNGGPK
ncbi:endoplasmic reticulum oxidoreductin 1 [Zopfochytrium polystomum]|nr:endoplasmic reticulum oxidoreductin 1 [Zopfochytrium polystomum]